MSFLNSIIGNKTVMKLALSTIKSAMDKEGISAIVILPSESTDGDTPGLEIKGYKEPIGVLSGEDLINYQKLLDSREFIINNPEKEVSNGI